MNRRSTWTHYRNGQRDITPTWALCLGGFVLGIVAMGFGELLLTVAS